jgi:hypothetical protein
MNGGIGNKAKQFHFWEYMNRILGTVCKPQELSISNLNNDALVTAQERPPLFPGVLLQS